MKAMLRRAVAALGAAALLCGSAFALNTQELTNILKERYAGDIPQQVWNQTTVEGMLEALGDPYTHVYTAQEYAQFQEGTREPSGAVTTAVEAGHIQVLTVPGFETGSYAAVKAAVVENDPAVDRWIVDLRNNQGGQPGEAVNAASVFLGKSSVAYLRDREGNLSVCRGENDVMTTDPVVVLVGQDTASAGELFAANIRDGKGGLVIGSRTRGNGVAQNILGQKEYPAAFGDGSALLLSTGLYFSQGFNSHNIMGVLPHLRVAEELAPQVARLLCASAPTGALDGVLRIDLAGWHWYVSLAQAQQSGGAFAELLAALPPATPLWLGAGKSWQKTTMDVVSKYYATGYTPRVFGDVDASPYKDAINTLKTYGIVQGDEFGRYNPKGVLDRKTLCVLLAQAMGYPKSAAAPAFADAPADAWYTPYVTTLSAMGIVNGYEDGLFHPHEPIPHQQFMAILARIAANTNVQVSGAMKAGVPDEVKGNYAGYAGWAQSAAWVLDGCWHKAAKDIAPQTTTTREEAAYDLWSTLTTLGLLPG